MRYLLFLVMLLFSSLIPAQTPIKTIPGFLAADLDIWFDHMRVSNSGNSIAIRYENRKFAFFDLNKGSVAMVNRDLQTLSSNHRYLYDNRSFIYRRDERDNFRYAWKIRSAGVLTDTVVRELVVDHYVLDTDEQNNFITTRIWYDSSSQNLRGMAGIYKLDRLSGKVLQTLRTDTFMVCWRYDGCNLPVFYLQKNYVAFAERTFRLEIKILPYGSDKVISIPAHDYNMAKADSLHIYTTLGSSITHQGVNVFDSRTGEMIAKRTYDRPAKSQLGFEFANNKIYRYDSQQPVIFEDQVQKDSIVTIKKWNTDQTLTMDKNQFWIVRVTKGPSFFMAPLYLKPAEETGGGANTALLFNTVLNKPTMQVYPFYNRSATLIASQAEGMKKQKEYLERSAKEAAEEKAKRCSTSWNNAEFKRGITRKWDGTYVIMASYDCEKDEYSLWIPNQPGQEMDFSAAKFITAPGATIRTYAVRSKEQYLTCTGCDGDGHVERTVYTTKTKELPWGYFSGIETRKITTTSSTKLTICTECHGRGIVLR
jgi:hypothetical protein